MSDAGKVLIIAKDKRDIENCQTCLSQLGCDIESTGSDLAEVVVADVVVLYAVTAQTLDLCRQIKEAELTRDTMVMVISDQCELADVERAINAGADDFLSKPVNESEMAKRVENLLRFRLL